MPVKLNSSGGGSVTLDVPVTASSFTLTIPAANGTLVGTASGATVQFGAGTAAAPSITFSGDTNTGIYSPAADTIAFAEGGVEAMRIDASGNVGIGSSANNVFDQIASARPLLVQSASSSTTIAGSSNSITIANSDTTTNNSSQINFAAITGASTNQYSTAVISAVHGARTNGQYPSGALVFSVAGGSNTAPTERARITAGGNFLVGTSSTFDNVSFNVAQVSGGLSTFINTTAATTQISFFNPNGRVGWVGTNGTSTSYNTSSDYRLKENVVPLKGASARVAALKPYRFNFIGDPAHTVDGFLAHEAAEVVPEAINGEKDAVDAEGRPIYQGIDQSKLVPLLTAALQEALSRIETLEARLAAVEAR